MTGSSPQGNIQQIILQNATDSFFAVSDSTNVVNTNTANTFWNIPSNISTGLYNLVVRIYNSVLQVFTDYPLNNGFTVTAAAATVSGYVFNDLNRNGIRDAGEHGMKGYTVHLNGSGNISVTDSNGYYMLGTVTGLDTITLTRPVDDIYSNTNSGSMPLTVVAGSNSGPDFGLVLSRFLVSVSPATDTIGATQNIIITDSLVTQNSTLVSVVLHSPMGNIYASSFSIVDAAHISASVYASQYSHVGKYDVIVTVTNNTTNTNRSFKLDSAFRILGPIGVISGYAYADTNHNGTKDPGEPGQAGQYVYISGGSYNYSEATDSTGFYSFSGLPNGNYSIQIYNPYFYYTSCGSGGYIYTPSSYTVTITNDTVSNKNYGAGTSSASSYDLFIHPGWRPANPGFVRHYWIFYGNLSNNPVNNGVITFQYDSTLVFDSCDRVPSTHNLATHTLTWNVGTVNPTPLGPWTAAVGGWYGGWYDFNLYMSVSVNDTAGRLLYSTFNISPTANDCSLWDNTVTDVTPVTSSMDPNEKHANPHDKLIYNKDSTIEYTINFQNTGTASTHFVIVKDTLDQSLDPKTVIPTGASAAYRFNNSNRVLTFTFDNLALTDSATDERHSHGSVSFMAKLKPGLAVGTVIKNTADIYFDYNQPVRTNTTVNTISTALGIRNVTQKDKVTLSPNPFTESTTLSFANQAGDKYMLTIYDIHGQVISTLETTDSQFIIQRGDMPAGVYLYRLTNMKTKSSLQGKLSAQ